MANRPLTLKQAIRAVKPPTDQDHKDFGTRLNKAIDAGKSYSQLCTTEQNRLFRPMEAE